MTTPSDTGGIGSLKEQQATLLAQARAGQWVRDDIILSLQPRLLSLAARIAPLGKALPFGVCLDVGDLVGEANLALFKSYERALSKDNPFAYLYQVARFTMLNCTRGLYDLIVTTSPQNRMYIVRFDTPIDEQGYTLSDVLSADLPVHRPDPSCALVAALPQALATLSKKQRTVIERYYGIEREPETLDAISQSMVRWARSAQGRAAHYHHRKALHRLEQLLAPVRAQSQEAVAS